MLLYSHTYLYLKLERRKVENRVILRRFCFHALQSDLLSATAHARPGTPEGLTATGAWQPSQNTAVHNSISRSDR